mmetsp:Transcript_6189/g.24949  ORF Transcript_6189/g.24949 Transcript_6189/m.24949 type:complete len:367 (-) Transcript_6189:960-2060(-)
MPIWACAPKAQSPRAAVIPIQRMSNSLFVMTGRTYSARPVWGGLRLARGVDRGASLLLQHRLHGRRDVLGREAEVLEQHAGRGGFAEAVDADHGVHAVLPPEVGHAHLDGHARQALGQHVLLVGLVLAVKNIGGGHGHHAHRDAVQGQLLLGAQGQLHLGAGGDDDGLGLVLLEADVGRLGQHIGALGDLVDIALRRIGQVLAGQREQARALGIAQGHGPGHHRLGRVGRAPDVQARDQAQAGDMLDGLVGRAVLTQADGVVRHHVDDALLHQRGHADGVAAVIAEGQEGAAVRNEAAVQRQPVHDRCHAELANAVVDVAPAARAGTHCAAAGEVGQVRSREVGAAAEHLGDLGCQDGQGLLGGLA